MDESLSHQPVLLPIIGAMLGKVSKAAAVLLLALALGVPPQVTFGQSNQQQEQQQREREQQQREQQQRDQQQRDQQERDRQQREQQQREQQQREQQERDRQQREDQERDRQQREQQERDQRQRDQQQREQQQREQQERDRQQREEQQREQQQRGQEHREHQERIEQQQHSSSNSAAPGSNASSAISHPVAKLPSTDVKPTTSDSHPVNLESKISSSHNENSRAIKKQPPTPIDHDLHGKLCADGPCKRPATQPIPVKPSAPERDTKLCKDGPCKPCPAGQSRAKDGSCALTSSAKTAAPQPSPKPVVQQACPSGQVWNGTQCQLIGAQQCMPGQSRVGISCQDCTIATGGSENIIERVRSARQSKDEICLKNPHGMECQQAELDYDLTLAEYRNFLAGVPVGCEAGLPDPIAI